MADFGVNNNTNFFNSMFGTGNTGSSTGGTSVLGDYAMIRSGAYKKLLNAYYKGDQKNEATGKVEETPEMKAEKNALVSMKTSASDLGKAATALSKTTSDVLSEADGNPLNEEQKKKVMDSAKDFVKAYNTLLDGSGDVENTKVLQKTLWMVSDVKANQKLLGEAGIKVGADNKLTLDEEKFKAANSSVLSTLFTGRNSLASQINGKTFDIANRASEAVTKLNGGTTYTDKGDYTKLNTSTLYDKLF